MQTPMTTQLRRYYQSGFTLIELLIVIAIIGILAAIAVPQYGAYLDRSARSACVSELSSFRSLVIAESATTGSVDVANNPVISGYNFESCDANDDKDDLATAFINGTTVAGGVSLQRGDDIDNVSVNNGQISATETPGAAPDNNNG